MSRKNDICWNLYRFALLLFVLIWNLMLVLPRTIQRRMSKRYLSNTLNNVLNMKIYIEAIAYLSMIICWMKILSIERLAYWKCFIADVVYFSWYITYVYCLLSVAIFTARMISVILAFSNYAKACARILIQI